MKTLESGYRARAKAGLRKLTTTFVPHCGTVIQTRAAATKVDLATLVKKIVETPQQHAGYVPHPGRKPRLALAMPHAS